MGGDLRRIGSPCASPNSISLMNNHSTSLPGSFRRGLLLTTLPLLPLAAPEARAVGGVADTVIILDDVSWRWNELPQWRHLIALTDEHVARTKQLIDVADHVLERNEEIVRLLGETKRAVGSYVGNVPSVLKPAETAVELETEKHALESSKNLFGLGSANLKYANPANNVQKTYQAFGKTHQRDAARYSHYAAQEAMYARYRTAAKNEEAVAKKEMAAQAEALRLLQRAATDSEVATFNAMITASQQRQALAHQKTMQAKSDLDAFRGQLVFEENRKKEADREWAGLVIERMREKALASYRAQMDGASAATTP